MTEYKVGDRVRLTGKEWQREYPELYQTEQTVSGINKDVYNLPELEGLGLYIYGPDNERFPEEDYSATLVENPGYEVTYEFDGGDPLYFKVQRQDHHGRWLDLKDEFFAQEEAREFARTLGRSTRSKTRVLRFNPKTV